jgi:hypothetical protein
MKCTNYSKSLGASNSTGENDGYVNIAKIAIQVNGHEADSNLTKLED